MARGHPFRDSKIANRAALRATVAGIVSGPERAYAAGYGDIALLAVASALVLHQYLAGAVVVLMLTEGDALVEVAECRARRELSARVQRTPRSPRAGELSSRAVAR